MADKGDDVSPGLEVADVVTKYKEAGDMASGVLWGRVVVALLIPAGQHCHAYTLAQCAPTHEISDANALT